MPRYGLSKRAVRHGFFSRAFFIGLSNLTRTLTIFTLPFYLGLILLLVAIRERRFKAALIYIALMVLGIAIVMLPWLIRQERMYGYSASLTISGKSFTRPPRPNTSNGLPAFARTPMRTGFQTQSAIATGTLCAKQRKI
jgi:4-amino-4-deoxy-L-arabinose transferase-like glycosyltransferase